jgi:hypothetical protein
MLGVMQVSPEVLPNADARDGVLRLDCADANLGFN